MRAQLDPRRAHVLRPARERPVRHHRPAHRLRDRMAARQRAPRRRRRPRRRGAVRLRDELGQRVRRPLGERSGVGAGHRAHRDLPARVRLELLRAHAGTARLDAADRRVEPGLGGRGRVPRAVRQPEPGRPVEHVPVADTRCSCRLLGRRCCSLCACLWPPTSSSGARSTDVDRLSPRRGAGGRRGRPGWLGTRSGGRD